MSILHPTPVASAALLWQPEFGMFTQEISTLQANGFRWGRVYDDAADAGLTLVSSRTGAEVVFVVSHTEVRGGDTCWWDLTPANGRPVGFTVRLFND